MLTVIKPNVSYVTEDQSVHYTSSGFDVQAYSTVANNSPIIYTINGKQYSSTVSAKDGQGKYSHTLSVHIPDDKFILQSITQKNEAYVSVAVFADEKPIPSSEFTDYLSKNPNIDLSNLTTEQIIDIVKQTSVEYMPDYRWYAFCSGTVTDEAIFTGSIECNSPYTINDVNQINTIILLGGTIGGYD